MIAYRQRDCSLVHVLVVGFGIGLVSGCQTRTAGRHDSLLAPEVEMARGGMPLPGGQGEIVQPFFCRFTQALPISARAKIAFLTLARFHDKNRRWPANRGELVGFLAGQEGTQSEVLDAIGAVQIDRIDGDQVVFSIEGENSARGAYTLQRDGNIVFRREAMVPREREPTADALKSADDSSDSPGPDAGDL